MKEALTFDDVLLVPKASSILPTQVDVSNKFTRHISLSIPIVSAAMDTVTESAMAIALAKVGGIGIIHKNMPIEKQAQEVERVKRHESWIVSSPITLSPENPLSVAFELMQLHNISGFPVVDRKGKLVGMLTKRDIRFEKHLSKPISKLMTKINLITCKPGTSQKESIIVLSKHKVEKLPIVDSHGILRGLITLKDITKKESSPLSTKDSLGKLRVGAAVGIAKDTLTRVKELVAAGCDAIVIDTAHAHSSYVIEMAKKIRKILTDTELVVGNIATAEATKALCNLDIDAVKVGIGVGSTCTTRIVTGIGMPQLTAIMDCAAASSVPVIADGGIRWSGDIVKSIAAGASTVMVGNLLAGTDESPGETILFEGRRYKQYRGMGSIGAMEKGSADRYFQQEVSKKLVPEGVEGRVPYRGYVAETIFQLIGGLKSGMGYSGAKNIPELQKKAEFVKITNAGLKESHPYSITITKEPPNY
ncbi:MAG: IMP dehydrogenase [Candidatus Stahlbacteria bacterium]|nr:IMP dehydrogenase [Candidatus Stahlbacteria bacterium]